MPKRDIKTRRLRKVSIGDMRDCISLENRSITAPTFDNVGFTQNYAQILQVFAKVETGFSNRRFDDVELDQRPSHLFTIRFRGDVTTETRIRYKGDLYRILEIDNFETRDEYLLLFATSDGDDSKEANQ